MPIPLMSTRAPAYSHGAFLLYRAQFPTEQKVFAYSANLMYSY